MNKEDIDRDGIPVERVVGRRWWVRVSALLVVAALASGVAILLRRSSVVGSVERQTIDLRFGIRGPRHADRRVVIVGLDDNSFVRLPSFPFSRVLHARVIDNLHSAGARVIVYDFGFDDPTTVSADDALASAAAQAAPVVFGTSLINHGQTRVLGGAANLRSIGAYAAAALVPVDGDGVIRHLSSEVDELPTMATVAQRLLTGHATSAKRLSDSSAWIDFRRAARHLTRR